MVLGLFLLPGLLLAQPPGGGRGFRGGPGGPGGPGGFFGGGTLGLIQQQEVQREIELSEEQEAELQTLGETVRDEIRGEMQGMFQNMRDLTDEERQARFDEIRARFEEINKDVEARMQKVLMPHQFDRLKQIELQARIERGGAAALTEGELADTLGLTESQRDAIRERAEQVQQDLQEKISQLRLEARNQLLEVLTAEQRAKLEAMMGAQFTLPEPQFGPGGRGGRGFGFGGRGGRGGGRNNAPAGQNSGN
jgi:Spy/CpxP family protein refolding chaperone